MSKSLRASLFFRYAQFLTLFGLNARALEFLQLAVRDDPRHRRAWTVYGFLRAEQGDVDTAIRSFERAVALGPGDADTCFNLAFLLQKAARHEEAIAQFQRSIDINANMDRAWYGMGISLLKRERYREAAEKFQEAARLQYFNPYAGYQLGAALFKLGEHEKVRAEYERVNGFDPKIGAQMRADFGIPKD
jgi:tetratricopeptide (TPR) repeat protein